MYIQKQSNSYKLVENDVFLASIDCTVTIPKKKWKQFFCVLENKMIEGKKKTNLFLVAREAQN